MKPADFQFKAIGELITKGRLRVPTHQRNYSWEIEHVEDLCQDFHKAEGKPDPYFLGTVVLMEGEAESLIVVDGQQRLATVTIMAAVIRDIFHARNDDQMVQSIESDFISKIARSTEAYTPNLTLNVTDNELFRSQILARPGTEDRKAKKNAKSTPSSNQKLLDARTTVRSFLEERLAGLPSQKDYLKAWLDLIEFKAMVIVLTVPSDSNAYRMFETLNDRGLKVSQADLVKNYLFGLAEAGRQREVQDAWARMMAILESVGEQDSTIDYLRFLCSMFYGLTTRGNVFDQVKENVSAQHGAIQFSLRIENIASDYAAILSPDHAKWNEYPSSVRRSLKTLASFDVSQVRHLMLAVAHHFNKRETDRVFRMLVDWVVRIFIAGAGKIGRLEKQYAELAYAIHHDPNKRTADEIFSTLKPYLPTDEEFKQAFGVARVSKERLARYYLDSLERSLLNEEDSDLVPNEDTSKVNLEHVIPRNWTDEHWPDLDKDTAEAFANRLGNQALLNAKKNALIGNYGFSKKREALEKSGFVLTKQIAEKSVWGPVEVEERQAALAEMAVKVWPLRRK